MTKGGASLIVALVSLGALISLGGCAVGPTYEPPAPLCAGAAAPLTSLNTAAETTALPPDDWWRLYDDPELDRLIQEAFVANADLAVAQANLSSARASPARLGEEMASIRKPTPTSGRSTAGTPSPTRSSRSAATPRRRPGSSTVSWTSPTSWTCSEGSGDRWRRRGTMRRPRSPRAIA